MKRLYKAALLMAALLILVGCTEPFEPPDPYPYSFSDPDQPYPRTLAGAQRFLSDAREEGEYDVYPHWRYKINWVVQSPTFSEQTRTGDCDDYAVMIAYYLQEYWGYDTFIVLLDLGPGQDDHAIAYVRAGDGLVDFSGCPGTIPALEWYGYTYYPVDWSRCPDWTWTLYGGTASYAYMEYQWVRVWNCKTNEWVWLYPGQPIEWSQLENLALALPPPEGLTNPSQNPAQRPAAIRSRARVRR